MPHYSIPVNKTILCWAEIDFEGTLEQVIEKIKNDIKYRKMTSVDVDEGMDEEILEYEPNGQHYCNEKEVECLN